MRLLSIILTELASDRLKLEEEIERIGNSTNISTEDKINMIKNLAKELAIVELAITRWKSTVDANKDENNKVT